MGREPKDLRIKSILPGGYLTTVISFVSTYNKISETIIVYLRIFFFFSISLRGDCLVLVSRVSLPVSGLFNWEYFKMYLFYGIPESEWFSTGRIQKLKIC